MSSTDPQRPTTHLTARWAFSVRGVALTLGLLALVACGAPSGNSGTQNPDTQNPGTQNPGTQGPTPPTGSAPQVTTWSSSVSAPLKRWESQGLAAQGKLFVMGGFMNTPANPVTATTESYTFDPASGTWTPIAKMPEALTHAGQALDDDTIWIAGGFVGNYDTITTTKHVWRYHISSDSWDSGPDLPTEAATPGRAGGALVLLGRELHYFAGTYRAGGEYKQDFDTHWALNLDNLAAGWTTRKPYPIKVNHTAGVALGGKIYGLGGQTFGSEVGGNKADVYAYDPDHDTWNAAAVMPRPLGHIAASTFVWNGHIVVAGGVTNVPSGGDTSDGGMEVANVISYDPAANKWTELTALPAPRQSPVANVIGGHAVVTTGDDKSPQNNTWISQ